MDNKEKIKINEKSKEAMVGLRLTQSFETNEFYIAGIEDTAQLIVSDLNCKVLLKQLINNEELVSISSFRKGVYIAKVITKTAIIEKKLVKK
jgi:hypothetical protein